MNAEVEQQLQALEAQYDETSPYGESAKAEPQEEAGQEAGQEAEWAPDVAAQEEYAPPGYKSYEDWVAEGYDPDLYRGKKAYENEYGRIQENKELKSDLKSIKETLNQTVNVIDDWKSEQTDQIRAQLEAELLAAKEDEDLEKALQTQDKINNLKVPEKKAAVPQENPAISQFRSGNPLVDPSNQRFNSEFNTDMESIYNSLVRDLSNGTGKLNEGQINRCLNLAFRKSKELHGNLFESPRNTKMSVHKTTKRARGDKTHPASRMSGYKIDSKNKSNRNAASDLYNLMKDKYGAEHADNFAKTLTGE